MTMTDVIVHWDEKTQAFVPGVAPMVRRQKSKLTSYRPPGLKWAHDDKWHRHIAGEYRRWLAARDAAAAAD